MTNYAIMGDGAVGTTPAFYVRRHDPNGRITIYSDEPTLGARTPRPIPHHEGGRTRPPRLVRARSGASSGSLDFDGQRYRQLEFGPLLGGQQVAVSVTAPRSTKP